MTRVRMEHAKLPGQPIHVRPQAMPAYRTAGWYEAPEPEPAPEQDESPAGQDKGAQPEQEQKPSRRRRATTTQQEEDDGADAA